MMFSDESYEMYVKNIQQIEIIPNLLDVICRTTGMGFAAIARVTEDKWLTCGVKDDISFGLGPGDELEVKSTLCHEIRQHKEVVVIDHVASDCKYQNHHTPLRYGFQSYISMPINRKDGSFFGTLCAIDPNPHKLNSPEVIGMFSLFSELIAFHLDAVESLQEKDRALKKINLELQSYNYISSHDLQEPLRKIQIFSNLIEERELESLSSKGKNYFERIRNAAERMQSLLIDLLSYANTGSSEKKIEVMDLGKIVQRLLVDFNEDLNYNNAKIEAGEMVHAQIIPFQIHQLLHNLISNSLNFRSPDRPLRIRLESTIGLGHEFNFDKLKDNYRYSRISVSDNGLGFDQKNSELIFEMFQRLHSSTLDIGTGLGLSIVKKIVENHKGAIRVTSKVNEGANFEIYLPFTKLEETNL